MATYTFHTSVPFYQGTDGYWGTDTFNQTHDGHPIGGLAPSSYLYQWRSIIGFDITPATGEKVTSFTLTIGVMKPVQTSTTNVALGAYLYNSLDTAKSVTSKAPSGYIATSAESSSKYTDASGRMVSLTFSGLNITSKTSLYAWFYIAPGAYYELWTGKSGNIVDPTITFTTQPISYTATFNANGGTTPNPQTITKGYGTALGTLPTTSRAGYTFKGWYTAASGGTKISTTTTMPAGNVTYYAQWSIIQYTISYDANGGTGAPTAQTKDYNATLKLSTTKPTWATSTDATYTITFDANSGSCSTSSLSTDKKTSHTFKNWNTAKAGTGTTYASGASYTANAAATLYAQWTTTTTTAPISLPVPTKSGGLITNYTVTFNANGGTCSTINATSAKTNSYLFQGWAESASATTGVKDSYTPTASKTLYAIWKETQSTEAITLPTPTRSNYIFKGWATSPTAVSGSFGSYAPNETITLYAIWGVDDNSGLIYIDNGEGWEAYEIYIDDGQGWSKYVPYIDNGVTWELYS